MLTLNQLAKSMETSNGAIKRMESAVATLNTVIDTAEKDSSRSRDYVVATVKAARDKALPALSAELKIVQDMALTSGAVQRFWESKPLLLSLQTFDTDAGKDSQIRMCSASELSRVPLPTLAATFENARFDKNLPLVYQCWLTGIGRSNEDGFTDVVDMTLDEVEIPGQQSALAAIATCLSNRSHAELMAVTAGGLRNDPVRKMNVARQQQVSAQMVAAADASSD